MPQDVGEISASVWGPSRESVDALTRIESDGFYHIRFTPVRGGRYTVDVLCAGHHIENSPMTMNVTEKQEMKVKLKEFEKQVNSLRRRPCLERNVNCKTQKAIKLILNHNIVLKTRELVINPKKFARF